MSLGDEYLQSTCTDCGQPIWMHVCRRMGDLVDVLPCVDMLIDYYGEEKWREEADEFDLCRQCGKPIINHLVFERPAFKAMGKIIWMRKPEVMIVFPCAQISCHLVTDEPLLGRVPPARVET